MNLFLIFMLEIFFNGILKTQSKQNTIFTTIFVPKIQDSTRLELPMWENPLRSVGIQYATLVGMCLNLGLIS
jgi:hypothetical protein